MEASRWVRRFRRTQVVEVWVDCVIARCAFRGLHVLSRSISVIVYNQTGGDHGRALKGHFSVVLWVVLTTHVLGVTDNVLNIHGKDPTRTDHAS